MKKYIKKLLVLTFSLWMVVFNTTYPIMVFADEPIDETIVIDTGDATSVSISESDVNVSQTTIETEDPTSIVVDTQQEASINDDTSSDSNSGLNEIDIEKDSAVINTGDATSLSETEDLINLNEVGISSSGSGEVDVITTQEAIVDSETSSVGNSGENTISAEDSSSIETGSSLAVSNTVNVVNMNVVGSNVFVYIDNISGEEVGDINLSELYESLNLAGVLPQDAVIITNQNADINSQTNSNSNSGENLITLGSGDIQTGDATSIANTINLANLNLVGNSGGFFVINILGSLLGNIYLPNLQGSEGLSNNLNIITSQESNISTSAEGDANSGENSLVGNGNITTGDATSVANTISYTNLVRIGDTWVWLLINNYGNWNGSLVNWDNPGEEKQLSTGTNFLEKDENVGNLVDGDSNLTVITNQNANINSQTEANSNTGKNIIDGNGEIITGSAFSLANDFSLANFVGVGGKFIFGILNIFGTWLGDLNVAYPDLLVTLTDNKDTVTADSSLKYVVTVTNNGKSKIKEINTSFTAPSDVQINLIDANRHIDELAPGENFTYEIDGLVSPTTLANTELKALVLVDSPEAEESKDNNSSSDTTLVVLPTIENNNNKDTRTPNLNIDVWNNVNDFVYPGDTVIAKITVVNQSPFLAREVKVNGSLSNDHPMPAIPMQWNLGDLKPGEKVQIEFSIGLIEELPGGQYHLSAEAKGKSESGDESSSGWLTSNFLIKLKYFIGQISPEVKAKEEILGIANTSLSSNSNFLVDIQKYLPYILAASVLILIMIALLRRKLKKNEK